MTETTAQEYYEMYKEMYVPGVDPMTGEINREVPFVCPRNGEYVDTKTAIGVGNSLDFDVVKFLAGYDEANAAVEPTAE